MNKENVITLDNPVKRGEQVIEQVTLMKPSAGTLRGVSLAAVANSEVDALIRYVCFYAPDAATPDHAA
ncbi:phage tail assembly protein [Escherichia coli]|nr:phage tail assembly protein [Escherichia coli]